MKYSLMSILSLLFLAASAPGAATAQDFNRDDDGHRYMASGAPIVWSASATSVMLTELASPRSVASFFCAYGSASPLGAAHVDSLTRVENESTDCRAPEVIGFVAIPAHAFKLTYEQMFAAEPNLRERLTRIVAAQPNFVFLAIADTTIVDPETPESSPSPVLVPRVFSIIYTLVVESAPQSMN